MSSAVLHRYAARLAWVAVPFIVALWALSSGAPGIAASKACPGDDAPAGSISTAKAERAVLCVINQRRTKRELPRLVRHEALDRAARDHALVMVKADCFKHRCPGEERLADRLAEYLVSGGGFGENIANGARESGSVRTVVRAWMKDEGNRRNVLDPEFEHVGIGVAEGIPGDAGMPGATYTVDFGYLSS